MQPDDRRFPLDMPYVPYVETQPLCVVCGEALGSVNLPDGQPACGWCCMAQLGLPDDTSEPSVAEPLSRIDQIWASVRRAFQRA